jgi:hypothetical protein
VIENSSPKAASLPPLRRPAKVKALPATGDGTVKVEDPEVLFGPLSDEEKRRPGSGLAEVHRDEQATLRFALSYSLPSPPAPDTQVWREFGELESSFSSWPELSASADDNLGAITSWHGIVSCDDVDTETSQAKGAIKSLSQQPTTGHFAVRLSSESLHVDDAHENTSNSLPWWRKINSHAAQDQLTK